MCISFTHRRQDRREHQREDGKHSRQHRVVLYNGALAAVPSPPFSFLAFAFVSYRLYLCLSIIPCTAVLHSDIHHCRYCLLVLRYVRRLLTELGSVTCFTDWFVSSLFFSFLSNILLLLRF